MKTITMRKLITGRTKYLILLLLFLAFESLSAQIYPVDITGMAIPPYSVKFYEYGTQGSEKFFINIRLNDIGELGRRVKLKIFLNGRGLNVSSKNYVQGAEAIYLDGGVNLRLTNNDLAPYFKYSNLNGMSSREYAGNLPTGFYKFGFQVFDYITNRPISLKFNIQMYIVLNSPPDLIAPKNEAQINYNEPPNIFFTWAPRHLNAMAARYEFTLKKIRYKGADPRQVFLSSPVYYQTETFTPSLVYGGGEPFLEEGMMYAWRVKAIVTTGISETSMFKNNGYSEIFWFTMLPQCEPPNMFETNNQNPDETKLTWEHFSGTSYKVEHRAPATDRNIANKSARNMKPSPWVMEKKTKKTEHLFSWNYQPDTDVEYRVGAECFPLSGYVWSEIQTFRTMSPEEKEEITKKRCEYRPASVVITDREPISLLRKGDFIYVRNYKVEIVQVTSQNNQHTGIGIAHGIPLFGQDSRMKMKFDNIKVNFAHQLIGGWVKSVYSEENWDKLEMNHEMGNIAETLKLLVNTVATMYETVEDLFNTGDITKKDLRTLKKALKQLEEDNDKLIVSREEAEELETLMNTALSEEQKERTQEKLDEINKEVAEISKTLVIDTEAMETRIAEIKAKAEKADASLYVQIKDKTHKYRRNETIYMVSQNKDLELIFGADVDSLMFAEAKWQLDGTSYQLPFLLDLNKTRNSSLEIIDSDNDGKGFEVNIQVYPKTIIKFEGSIIELDGKASDKKIEPGLKPNNELTIKDNEDYIVHELIINNEKKVKFDINIIEDDLAKEDSNYKITFKSRDDKVKINTSNSYIELDISKLDNEYAYITAHDQSEQVVGKLIIYRTGETVTGVVNNTETTNKMILSLSAKSTKSASKYTKGTACNICVRGALYLIKNDSLLFPKTGSGHYDPNDMYKYKEVYGKISGNGLASYIKSDFDKIATNTDINDTYKEIKKTSTQTWSEFFKDLQDKADRAEIIIGVMMNSSNTTGHIIMITPGGLVDITENTLTWGGSFTMEGREITKLPRVLECGGKKRETEAPLCLNIDYKGATKRLKWYKYIK